MARVRKPRGAVPSPCATVGTPVMVAYPAAYDTMWVQWYLHRFAGDDPFRRRAIDIKTLAMVGMGKGYRTAPKARMPRHWHSVAGHTHVAVDDTHNESIMHSSAPVVATALALGEWVRASGREAIVLVAAGNELNCRLGWVAPGRFHDHGFHPTGVLGSITSAILAGRMLGLDASGAAHAAGIAGSQASGILEAYAGQPPVRNRRGAPGRLARAGALHRSVDRRACGARAGRQGLLDGGSVTVSHRAVQGDRDHRDRRRAPRNRRARS